jgi:hypothetical protein
MKRVVARGNKQNKIKLSQPTINQKIRLRELGEKIKSVEDPEIKQLLKKDYASLEKYVGFCMNNDARLYYAGCIEKSKNKSSAAWKIVHAENDSAKTQTSLEDIVIDGECVKDPLVIANHLNRKFIESSPENLESLISNYSLPLEVNTIFQLSPVTPLEVLEIIKKLPSKKCAGPDGITMQMLKAVAEWVALPLSHLINCSFEEGRFSSILKTAIVIPLYKKGDRQCAENYRPIALTSSLSKVFEKAYLNRLTDYFAANELLLDNQHGFRQGRSTVSALFDVVTEVFKSLEKREKLNLILYDFSNAFGCLVPELLVQKLKLYGLDEMPLNWIKSFLTERSQMVQLKSMDKNRMQRIVSSDVQQCSMGVPQGSVAGPFSYSIYGNDMPLHVVLGCLVMFADDTTALVKGKTYSEANTKTVQVNNQMVNYAEANGLRLNPSKTKILQMHPRQARNIVEPEVFLQGEQVEKAEDGKLLGVMLNDKMSWKKQCEDVQGRLRSTTYMFVKLRQRLPYNILRSLYFCYTQSHILYAIAIWGASPHLKKVFVAQKRVVRALEGVRYWKGKSPVVSCRPLFKKHGIPPVYSLYVLECVKFVKKYPEKFRLNSDVYKYDSRNKDKLYVEASSLQMSEGNPAVQMVRLYNMLPACVRNLEKYDDFVLVVKKICTEQMFYDHEEYSSCDFSTLC